MRSVIKGKRVKLRKLQMKDAVDIFEYAKDYAVSRYTQNMPYPYERKDAVWWVNDSAKNLKNKKRYTYGIEYGRKIIGSITLTPKPGDIAEMGYSIGKSYWGKGITTEAANLVLREGFKTLKINKIYATHHPKNPASGRVMQKIGMKYEGLLREHAKAKGKYWDLVHYGILRREFKG